MKLFVRIVKKLLSFVLKTALAVAVSVCLVVAAVNFYVVNSANGAIITAEQAKSNAQQEPYDCIVVLGASVYSDGTLSDILKQRVDDAIALYKAGVAPKIIMSGDGVDLGYDEPDAMKAYAVSQGVPSEDVFCDRAGINTFNTMYRVANVFGAKRIVVCTQTYHMYRSVYTAQSLGMQAVGVPSDADDRYFNLEYEAREIISRCKAMAEVKTGQTSESMEEPISLSESGDITNRL